MASDSPLGSETVYPDTVKLLTALPGLGSVPCRVIIQCALIVDGAGKGNVAVRFTTNGITTPTSDVGFELNPGQIYTTSAAPEKLQFIGVAANARLNVLYESWPPSEYVS